LNQSFSDLELIVIDDGSKDDSVSELGKVNDFRLLVFRQENQGVATALNNGLVKAHGKLIWRHDADDLAERDQLASQIRFLDSHPDFDLVSTQIAFMTERGKRALDIRHPEDAFYGNSSWREVRRSDLSPERACPIVHATVLARRAALGLSPPYRSLFKVAEDIDLWLRLLETRRIAALRRCGYYVRLHSNSTCKRNHEAAQYYRELAYEFARRRHESGADNAERDAFIPPQPTNHTSVKVNTDGALYLYRVAINAGDWISASRLAVSILHATRGGCTKELIFPILGRKLVNRGVRAKRAIRLWLSPRSDPDGMHPPSELS
jgi:glycosyltransferase involved in cell wall biosynthesis